MKKLILILFIFSFISCEKDISTSGSTSTKISSATVNGVKEFCGAGNDQQTMDASSRSSGNAFYGITENGNVEIVLEDENGNKVEDIVISMIYNVGEDFCYVETHAKTDSYKQNNYIFSKKSGKGIKVTLEIRDVFGSFAFIDNNGNTYIRATITHTEGMSIITENGIIKLSQDASGDNITVEMLPKSKTKGMMLVNKFGTLYEATGETGYFGYYPNRFCSSEIAVRSGEKIHTSVFASNDTDELFEFENGKFTKITKSGTEYIRTLVLEYKREGFFEYNILQNENSFYIVKKDLSEIMRINSDGTHSVYPTDLKDNFRPLEFTYSVIDKNTIHLGKHIIIRGDVDRYRMVNLENGEATSLPELCERGNLEGISADGKSIYCGGSEYVGDPITSGKLEYYYYLDRWDLETRTVTEIIKSNEPIHIMGNDFRE